MQITANPNVRRFRQQFEATMDLNTLRTKLTAGRGSAYWRTLAELAGSEEFTEALRREFPRHLGEMPDAADPVTRRAFISLMGASLALAGLAGCSRHPHGEIVPYVHPPAGLVPGEPQFYATAEVRGGYARGIIVRSNEHRPTKIEGNPDHPSSLGGTDAITQGSLLSLYDPDRAGGITRLGNPDTWDGFILAAQAAMEAQRTVHGAGLRLLTEPVTSPTMAAQIAALLAQYPAARWHVYSPVNGDNARAGAARAFGVEADTIYRFDRADTILSLDSDFLMDLPGSVRYARDFADGRRVRTKPISAAQPARDAMNRLYVVESSHTITGASADHRFPVRPSLVETLAVAIAGRVGVAGPPNAGPLPIPEATLDAIARDLRASGRRSLVIAGEVQPPDVHALAHAMNHAIGGAGNTCLFTDPVEASPPGGPAGTLAELAADLDGGLVQSLVMLGGNAAYDAPADIDIASRLRAYAARPGAFCVHLSPYADETSALSQWHVPETHYLEAWGDARAHDGIVTIQQPLIAPLYDGRSAIEVLAVLLRSEIRAGHAIVRAYWQGRRGGAGGASTTAATEKAVGRNLGGRSTGSAETEHSAGGAAFASFWTESLNRGVVAGTAAPTRTVTPRAGWQPRVAPAPTAQGMEVVFRPDPAVWDGRYANNGWLQELPRPLMHLTWDNAAIVSPRTALHLGVMAGKADEDRVDMTVEAAEKPIVELRVDGRTLQAAALVAPGQPDDCVTLHLGYGRTSAGSVGNGLGFDAYRLRTSQSPGFLAEVDVRKTSATYVLAVTHAHHSMNGRELVRDATMEGFRANPHFATEPEDVQTVTYGYSLYPGYRDLYKDQPYAWGMSIDNSVCIGCQACVQACQAENNIPIVGKGQVLNSREMHWIRIESYFRGGVDNPQTVFSPVPCMHCENAPCELVCPVGATVHSKDGLNQMVYNRCVGTRYCSNNCPYKVRRFNFFQYSNGFNLRSPVVQLMRNPEVTVRTRGVMEKCSYCIQRIEEARIQSEKEDRLIRDGEVVPACAQACPTRAIVFGNIKDPQSAVSRLKAEPHNYGILTELNTRPRTTYLAKLTNPNPEIAST